MEQQTLFKVRDRRKKGWFFMDNEYLNGYAKFFGAVGTAVYVSLCRHADNETQKCFPSLELISKELNISRPTIIKYIKLFEKYRLVEIIKGKRNIKQQWLNNEYILLDKTEWIKKESQVKPFNTESQVKPFSNPSKTDNDTQVKLFNTKETHIKDTHIKDTHPAIVPIADKQENKQISEVIDLFKDIDISYKDWFKNTTQRKSAEKLLIRAPIEKLKQLVEQILPVLNSMPYTSKDCKAFNPYELNKNWAKIMAKIKEKQIEKNQGQKIKILK